MDSRIEGLTAQLRDVEARYMALVKAVADGMAMQPGRSTMMLARAPLSDDDALKAWWSVAPDGTNVGGGCSLDGWMRAVRWTEKMHMVGA